ncbi:MAG: substrate-binding domain-containing protein [Candidatus Omnitrophota bacterium]|nr:MAG: substrate-binding domain-containing protein [Candidatus Omnitrophota bacterium]
MKQLKFYLLIIFLLTAFLNNNAGAEEILRIATTTSTYETGLLDYIFPPFEKKYDTKIHIISVGTGKAIKLGENGDVDVILVHAREAEDKFVNDGFGVNRRDVMYNDFIILGPQSDAAGVSGLKDAKEALKRIYYTRPTFISRGDDSGTHKKEKHLWEKAGVTPKGNWYLETGQGMNATLRVADEKSAYVMIDRATYLSNKNNITLKKLVEADKDLFNPYGIIAINPYKYPHVKHKLSMALIGWITSPQCQKMIENYKKGGHQLYYANADK